MRVQGAVPARARPGAFGRGGGSHLPDLPGGLFLLQAPLYVYRQREGMAGGLHRQGEALLPAALPRRAPGPGALGEVIEWSKE